MSVAKMIEISSSSRESFEDAIRRGVARASDTVENVTSAWVADQEVTLEKGKIEEYRVRMKVTFLLK